MGIQGDNAHEMVITMEGMASGMREDARAIAASIARRAPRPLADYAQALADADGQEAMEKAFKQFADELGKALRLAKSAWRRHMGKGDTDVGNFTKAYSTMINFALARNDIGKLLDNAELHDVLTQEFRNVEKGFREIGL